MRTTSTSRSLLLTVLVCIVRSSLSHDCDNESSLPTLADLKDLFSLVKLADGSFFNPVHESDIQVIPNPTDVDNLAYTEASSVGLFLLTTEENEFGWCPVECASADDDNDDCYEDCVEENEISYGLSYFHKLSHDETWHFYFGDTIYIYELDDSAAGDVTVILLGADADNGEVTSHTIPAGTWFGAQVNPDSESDADYRYSFGAVVAAPKFEIGDYELADITYEHTDLADTFPNMADKISELSFHPVNTDELVEQFGHEGVNSLCETEHGHNAQEDLTLDEVIDHYVMEEGPIGGYFVESYTSPTEVLTDYGGTRAAMSDHYYAMNDTVFFRRQHSDETIHFYDGEPITLYEIDDTERPTVLRIVPIGSDVMIGQIPHYTVKQNSWVAFEFKNNNWTYWNEANSTPYTFLGLTNAPGFDEVDLEFGVPEAMVQNFPEFATTIISLYANAQNAADLEDILNATTANCNLTELTIATFNVSECYNVTFNSTNATLTGFNSAQSAVRTGPSKGGKVTLYLLGAMACVAVMAFVMMKRRNARDPTMVPDGVTVVCERGGQVQNLETVSVAGKSRGSVGYIDFAGVVHSNR